MKTVSIIQRVLPDYRIPFFHALAQVLEKSGVRLRVYYGQERPGTVPKTKDCGEMWAVRVENRYYGTHKREMVWQPCLDCLKDSDLIIVEQANRLLVNYLFLFLRAIGRTKIAFWGHGMNMQNRNPSTLNAVMKRILLNRVDWWFAYTELTKTLLLNANVPGRKISVVQNTIDSSSFQEAMSRCGYDCVEEHRLRAGIGTGVLGIYCGGIYSHKRIEFLLAAANLIKARIADFQLLVIGDGPDRYLVEEAARQSDAIVYLGPLFGQDRVPYMKMADIMLMPGLVGLAVIDTFVSETPMLTTDVPLHSPEIAYLVHGVNGLITEDDVETYANDAVKLLQDGELGHFKSECKKSAAVYTLEAMVSNFADGVLRATGEK